MNRDLLIAVAGLMITFCTNAMLLLQSNQLTTRRLIMFMHHRQRSRIRRTRRILHILTALGSCKEKKRKHFWKRQISEDWWKNIVPGFDDDQWYENFRMRRGTFDWLCSKLGPMLKPHPSPVAPNPFILSTEKRVAIALYKLASLAEYKVVANQFGVHQITVHNCVYSVCLAISELLGDEFLKFPGEDEAEEIAKRFEAKSNVPQIIGAIGGTHIPIKPPVDGNADFINRKLHPSIVLQAIVDDKYTFRDISCKLPGSCNDRDALYQSSFYQNVDKFMPKSSKKVDNWDIPYMIVGDSAYPLLPWLIKNYDYDGNISPEKDSFNVYLNKARVCVENAFGRLKGRWRILCRSSDISNTFMPVVVLACCILHNICEMSKETHQSYEARVERWVEAAESEALDPQPDQENFNAEDDTQAKDMRDHLMLRLSRMCPLLMSSRGRVSRM